MDLPRFNGAIRALEQGKPAFTTFCPPEVGMAQAINAAPYDAVVFEMEHHPYDIRALRDCLQYMLDRRQIHKAGSLAPAVTPMVRIPANGGEMNQFLAKQVLDLGVYGVIWPHVSTVEEASQRGRRVPLSAPVLRAALRARGPARRRPASTRRPTGGSRSRSTTRAPTCGRSIRKGEILVGIMCEEVQAIGNLPQILEKVPGIGFVLIGEGDLSQDLGFPRQYDHPALLSAIDESSPSARRTTSFAAIRTSTPRTSRRCSGRASAG